MRQAPAVLTSIALLAGCRRPCGVLAHTVWLMDGDGSVRVDVKDDWDDVELDGSHQVWAAHDDDLWVDGDALGVEPWGWTTQLVRAGDSVASIEWTVQSGLAIRDPIDAEPTQLVDDPWLRTLEAAGSDKGIVIAWSSRVELDYDQEEVHVGWWSEGSWTEELLLTGHGVDTVSLHDETILVTAGGYDEHVTRLGSVSAHNWTALDLGEGVDDAVLAADDSVWFTSMREDEDGGYTSYLEHLGGCSTAIEWGAYELAIRPQGPGVDVYHINGDGQPYRSRRDDDCKLLGSTPLDAAPDTTASFHHHTLTRSGSTAKLGGAWWAESPTAGFEFWEEPGCK